MTGVLVADSATETNDVDAGLAEEAAVDVQQALIDDLARPAVKGDSAARDQLIAAVVNALPCEQVRRDDGVSNGPRDVGGGAGRGNSAPPPRTLNSHQRLPALPKGCATKGPVGMHRRIER
jgi:hypothetical protein